MKRVLQDNQPGFGLNGVVVRQPATPTILVLEVERWSGVSILDEPRFIQALLKAGRPPHLRRLPVHQPGERRGSGDLFDGSRGYILSELGLGDNVDGDAVPAERAAERLKDFMACLLQRS